MMNNSNNVLLEKFHFLVNQFIFNSDGFHRNHHEETEVEFVSTEEFQRE